MNLKRSRPKGHHFVPASYLRRFTDATGFVHVYDSRRNHLRRQRPEKIMKIDAYYRQTWAPSGVDVDIFETSIGGWLEAEAPAVFDKLINTDEAPTDDEAISLLFYIELQRIRVPRQVAPSVELMRTTIERNLPKQFAERVASGELHVYMKGSARFDSIRMAIGALYPWLAQMEWEVVIAEQGSNFITSDSPVSFYNPAVPPPAEAGVAMAGTKILFPLSSTHLLLIKHPESRTRPPLEVLPELKWESIQMKIYRGTVWPRKVVEETNWKIAMLAHDLIAAANVDLLRATNWKRICSIL